MGELDGIDWGEEAEGVDVTKMADEVKQKVAGIPEQVLTVTIKGRVQDNAIEVGDTGAVSIAWNDGAPGTTIANAVCLSFNTSANLDEAIQSTLSFAPSPA